jgi:hypothetical protein
MTPAELHDCCIHYRRRFYSAGSILYRGLDWRANCNQPRKALAFFGQNFLHRGEVARRDGLPLGVAE